MKVNWRSVLTLLLLVVAVIIASTLMTRTATQTEQLEYSDLLAKFEKDYITDFEVDAYNKITVHYLTPRVDEHGVDVKDAQGNVLFKTDDKGKNVLTAATYKFSYSFQLEQINDIAYAKYTSGTSRLTAYNYAPPVQTPWYLTYLPYLIIAAAFIGLWFFVLRSSSAMGGKMSSFSKSRARVAYNEKNPVKFADVAGADEEKAELEEVVEFLRDPQKYVKLGARIPRGVLLVGPPGTGKTLLAKAVAGEAGVPFFSISGSDFVEMYVGVGASRVRDLFENARKANASIIFIDEIDAVGRHRGAGLGGGHDEREQTLNQLLVEMDGFGTNSGVIVMAATNRPDILDPALLRPGRFDRRVTVNYPDMRGREEILKVHCRNKPLEASVELSKIAQTTIGFTGADLANLMNEAALHAAKMNKALIGMDDIEGAYMKAILGPQKKGKIRTPEDNKLCAYHEAGHAVASYYCKHTDPIKHITIIPAGSAGGVTISVPTKDQMGTSRAQMIDRIVWGLGGRVAEQIILDDVSTGAASDIQHATAIARDMVTRYGMSEKLGTVLYGSEHSEDEVFLGRDFSSGRNYSEKTAAQIDDEIRRIIADAYATCHSILTAHVDKLHFIAQFLLKNESMDEEQFAAAMREENPTMEQIEAIATEKQRKSENENRTAHENNAKAQEQEQENEKQQEPSDSPKGFSDDDLLRMFGMKDSSDDSSDSSGDAGNRPS